MTIDCAQNYLQFKEMERLFEAQYPNVNVLREAGGSTKMARLISEVGKPADIMASADFAVIDKSLIPERAEWNVRAEKHYQQPGLYDRLIANRPEENIKARVVELVLLLKAGNMDYAWEYLSVAVQYELCYVVLPDQINLGNYEYDDFYQHDQHSSS